MTQPSQQPGLPPDSDALPSPVSAHDRDLGAVVAGGVSQPPTVTTPRDRQWHQWPFAVEVWLIAITIIAIPVATLLFGGAGFAVALWVAIGFWFVIYGLIYKVVLDG